MKPSWWSSGRVIHSDQFGPDEYDIGEFLEGEEFEYEWRLCRVPLKMISKIDLSTIDQGDSEEERRDSIRAWFDSAGVSKALLNTPPVLLLYRGRIRILDGWHRIAIAQEYGALTIPAAVGYGRGEE